MAETDYVTNLNIVSWVLGGLVIVITIARIIGRTLFMKQTGWDDFFMILGSVRLPAAGATIVKIYLLKDLDKHSDITWYWAPITMWYTAEMDVIIIVGTIPTLWPLVRLIQRRKKHSHGHAVYDIVTGDSSYQNGSEGIQLGGSATRALREVDNM
ncbi:hypothetical protein CHU98_g2032 [Xylaria longipes]|nr:hypothetical protein CHU98_g2032 [Xylaria longipes]